MPSHPRLDRSDAALCETTSHAPTTSRSQTRGVAVSLGGLAIAAALALAPAIAGACSTGEEFIYQVHETYPADGASAVPIDAPLAILGTANLDGELMVEILVDGVAVPGALVGAGKRLYWRPDAPFAANTEHLVHLWTEAVNASEQVDEMFTFTTGDAPAPALAAPAIELSLSKWEKKYYDCVEPPEPGDCDDCGKEVVTKIEERMQVRVTFPHPGGPFGRFYRGQFRRGASAEEVAEGSSHVSEFWADAESSLGVTDDLGLVGTWESDEVCVRAWIWDPRELTSEEVITCAPIGEVNVPSESGSTESDTDTDTDTDTGGETSGGETSGGETSGSASESGDGSAGSAGSAGSSGDTGGGQDEDGAGCSCQADDGPGRAALLFGFALWLARPRRRRARPRRA